MANGRIFDAKDCFQYNDVEACKLLNINWIPKDWKEIKTKNEVVCFCGKKIGKRQLGYYCKELKQVFCDDCFLRSVGYE